MAMNPGTPSNIPPANENVAGPPAGAYNTNTTVPESALPGATMAAPRNLVSWGPVWAGLLATLLTFLILETLMVGFGIFTPTANGATGNTTAAAWVTAIVALIAFFVGGWVSGITSAVRGTSPGIVNGLAVWGLGVAIILLLSLFGLSQLFGALGSIVGQFYRTGTTIPLPPITPSGVASTAQAAGWAAFFSLILTGIAAALGGWLATRTAPLWNTASRPATPYRRNAPV